jgi:hypothetical protein
MVVIHKVIPSLFPQIFDENTASVDTENRHFKSPDEAAAAASHASAAAAAKSDKGHKHRIPPPHASSSRSAKSSVAATVGSSSSSSSSRSQKSHSANVAEIGPISSNYSVIFRRVATLSLCSELPPVSCLHLFIMTNLIKPDFSLQCGHMRLDCLGRVLFVQVYLRDRLPMLIHMCCSCWFPCVTHEMSTPTSDT